jgi:hypothetical protein
MTTETLPAKGAAAMQFASSRVEDLWGRAKRDPQWRSDGNQLANGKGNKLKLVDGKWVSA